MTRDVRLPPLQLWIGGEWCASRSGATFALADPATGDPIGDVAAAQPEDVDRACVSASEAQLAWARRSPFERAAILHAIGDQLLVVLEELARVETLDAGKPIGDTRGIDVPLAARAFHYFASWPRHITGETIPVEREAHVYTVREPLGVVAALTPWNFPLFVATLKIAPALAAGCAVVLKPSELAPLTALCLAEIAARAGLPAGVLNVITGAGEPTGRALVEHRDVAGVTFTGGAATAHRIAANAGIKKLNFELGGKSAHLVLADADVDSAVEAACMGAFYNTGQSCCAGSRLFVADAIADLFLARLVERTKRLRVGDPFDPATELGPLISATHAQRLDDYLAIARSEGAVLLDTTTPHARGHWRTPAIVAGLPARSRLEQEEIFGPLLTVTRFTDLDAAIVRANDTPFGLAAGIWTRDLAVAHRTARRLRAGTVWINTYGPFDHAVPFGGSLQSGTGREGGAAAIEFFTQSKTVWISL